MAVHTKKEFAKLLGMTTRELAVYIGRDAVVLTGDKIDDTIAENVDFIAKRQSKQQDGKDHKQFNVTVKATKQTAAEKKALDERRALDTKRKELDTRKVEEEIELLTLKKQKIHGIVIPVDLVKSLFQQQFKSITVAFQHGAQDIIVEISKKKKLTREESAKLRQKLVGIINNAVRESVSMTGKSIENIQKEYSETRGQGERR